MRRVGGQHQVVVAEHLHRHLEVLVLERLAADVHLPHEVLAGLHLEPRHQVRQLLVVLVHAPQPPRHLRGAGLQAHEVQLREAFQHAAADERHHAHHGLEDASHHVREEEVVGEPFLAHGLVLGVVDDDGPAQVLQLGVDGVVVGVPPLASGHRHGLHVEGLVAHVRHAVKLLDRQVHVLPRNHARPSQTFRKLAGVLPHVVVLGAAIGGRQLRVVRKPHQVQRRRVGGQHRDVDGVLVQVAHPAPGRQVFRLVPHGLLAALPRHFRPYHDARPHQGLAPFVGGGGKRPGEILLPRILDAVLPVRHVAHQMAVEVDDLGTVDGHGVLLSGWPLPRAAFAEA